MPRIGDTGRLLGHPVAGASWEGWVIGQALAAAGNRSGACFYRTAAGAEINLLIERPHGRRLAFDIKLGSAPAPARGLWSALSDLKPDAAFVVYPGKERYPLAQGVEALPVSILGEVLDG